MHWFLKIRKFWQPKKSLNGKKRAYSDLAKRLKDNEALSTRAMKKLSEKQKIIQEQKKLIKEKEKDSTERLEAAENLYGTLSTRATNKINKKEKIIQEQAKQIEEKEKEGKKILAATENLKESERSQAEMAKRLE